MTMPHLMNCKHHADAICLSCAKEIFERAEKREENALGKLQQCEAENRTLRQQLGQNLH